MQTVGRYLANRPSVDYFYLHKNHLKWLVEDCQVGTLIIATSYCIDGWLIDQFAIELIIIIVSHPIFFSESVGQLCNEAYCFFFLILHCDTGGMLRVGNRKLWRSSCFVLCVILKYLKSRDMWRIIFLASELILQSLDCLLESCLVTLLQSSSLSSLPVWILCLLTLLTHNIMLQYVHHA